jgi:hypothetical protein
LRDRWCFLPEHYLTRTWLNPTSEANEIRLLVRSPLPRGGNAGVSTLNALALSASVSAWGGRGATAYVPWRIASPQRACPGRPLAPAHNSLERPVARELSNDQVPKWSAFSQIILVRGGNNHFLSCRSFCRKISPGRLDLCAAPPMIHTLWVYEGSECR